MDLEQVRAELEQAVREADAVTLTAAYQDEPDEEEDKAQELTEADREEALAALARLDDGTYGTCVDCGKPIDEERLSFRPEAARCLEDQQAFEEREA
jgi:RNA polymerase-binding transcription factor DksA